MTRHRTPDAGAAPLRSPGAAFLRSGGATRLRSAGAAFAAVFLALGCASASGGGGGGPEARGSRTGAAASPEAGAPGPYLYVANQAPAAVTVIDAGAAEVVEVVDLRSLGFSANAKPHDTAVEPDGSHWYVSLIAENVVLKFDRTNELVGRVEFEAPGLLTLDPGSDRLYVGRSMAAVNPPRRIGIIDRSDMTIEEVEVFFPRPHALALGPGGETVYVGSLAENRIAALDVESGAVEILEVEGATTHVFVDFAVSPDGRWLVGTGQMTGKLLVFDLEDPTRPSLSRTLDVDPQPWHPVFTPDGTQVWFGSLEGNSVTVVDARDWNVGAVIRGEGIAEPHGAAVTPDGTTVFISSRNLEGEYAPARGAGGAAAAGATGAEGARAGTEGAPGTVVAIDPGTREIRAVIPVPVYAAGMSTIPPPRPAGRR